MPNIGDELDNTLPQDSLSILERIVNKSKEVQREEAKDFVKYLEAVGRDQNGEKYHVDNLTKIMATVLEDCYAKKRHISIIVAPGSGKSTLARHLLLWAIGNNNYLRTNIVKGSRDESENAGVLCRNILI